MLLMWFKLNVIYKLLIKKIFVLYQAINSLYNMSEFCNQSGIEFSYSNLINKPYKVSLLLWNSYEAQSMGIVRCKNIVFQI